jgi:hypothetical protein
MPSRLRNRRANQTKAPALPQTESPCCGFGGGLISNLDGLWVPKAAAQQSRARDHTRDLARYRPVIRINLEVMSLSATTLAC